MSINSLRSSLDQLAKEIGCKVQQSRKLASLAYIDLALSGMEGQVRLSVDNGDAVVIAEVAVPFSTLLPPDAAAAETLLALHMLLSPAQSGARLFPSMDMQSEHLMLTCVIGSEALRGAEGLAQFVGDCAERVAALIKKVNATLDVNQTLRTKPTDAKNYAASSKFLNRIRSG